MNLHFDLQNVRVTEFGVGRDDGNGQTFVEVPVDADVQMALREMAQSTWNEMRNESGEPARYEPAEKHGGTEYLYLPAEDELAVSVQQLHNGRSSADR